MAVYKINPERQIEKEDIQSFTWRWNASYTEIRVSYNEKVILTFKPYEIDALKTNPDALFEDYIANELAQGQHVNVIRGRFEVHYGV